MTTAEPPGSSAAETRRADLESQLDDYRRELNGYCYRMLGSSFDAEDAVQNAMVRAWRALDRFDGRSSLRTWLYRITHNVCLDMLRGTRRRALPLDLGPDSTAPVTLDAPLAGETRPEPLATGSAIPAHLDPAERAVQSEAIRMAFGAALQELPPKQRAVLILREVLRWPAADVAALLDTTVAGVNSALQRARTTLERADRVTPVAVDDGDRALLAQYVEAFADLDLDRLVTLLHDDATHSLPTWRPGLEGAHEGNPWPRRRAPGVPADPGRRRRDPRVRPAPPQRARRTPRALGRAPPGSSTARSPRPPTSPTSHRTLLPQLGQPDDPGDPVAPTSPPDQTPEPRPRRRMLRSL